MASTFSNLKFELIGTGDQSGTWGTTTNTNLGTAIEQALVGMATISSGFVTNSLTLTLTDTNAAQNARALVLNLTQALSGAGTLNVPAIQKPYMIINATGQTVTVKVTGLTGVAVPTGTRAFLYNNGTDVGEFFNYHSSLTLGTALPITSGGTGTTSTTFVNLTTNVTGTLPIANGGTGTTSTTFANLATNVTGTLPIANGGTGTTSTTFVNLATNVTGTLPIANGGTAASTAPNARTNLGATTVGSNFFTLTNPSAITFPRMNADNTVSALDAATFRTAIGAGTTSGAAGSNTQVQYNNAGAFGGSANFVFDGTNVGIGTSSPANIGAGYPHLEVNGSITGVISVSAGGVRGLSLSADNSAANIQSRVNGQALTFSTNSGSLTERMRIDSSGNVGIGTSSPLARLTVSDSTATNGTMTLGNNASYNGTLQYIFSTGELRISQVGGASLGTTFYTAGSERMRIDSSGNVGIGLTPVANNGILQLNSYGAIKALIEGATVSATAATGTINYDAATQAVVYYTSNASANWTVNFRGSASLSLNSMMQTGQSLTVAFLVTQGSTAYYNSAVQVDGSSVTPKWQGGTAPSAGNASSIDSYVYTIIKTGAATFTVLASQTKFA